MACFCEDPADGWNEQRRKARKEHVCYECNGKINKGDEYMVVSWCRAGEGWDSVKVCEFCWHDWEYLRSEGHCILLGGLQESWDEHWEPRVVVETNRLASRLGGV